MKLNNKGFAITGIIYAILLLFIVLILGILSTLGNRKIILDKLKSEIIDKIQTSDLYKDNSGANQPLLLNNMTPVMYDNESSNWIVADIHEKWYDYDEYIWANAVILKENVYKNVGDVVDVEKDVALMYVWIPRFKYTVWNGNNKTEGNEYETINIEFESGTNTTGTVKCSDSISGSGNSSQTCNLITDGVSTYTHPAFTFGVQELTGFWVGKFELSTTDKTCLASPSVANCNKNTHKLETKPNKDSLRYISVGNMFESNLNIIDDYNITNGNSHMIKNVEWSAVLYLMNSTYSVCFDGSCGDVYSNLAGLNVEPYTTITGCSLGTTGTLKCDNTYNSNNGIFSSTSYTIEGVYDMSGGAAEYVMANMVDNSGNFYPSATQFTSEPESKYYDAYTYNTNSSIYSIGKLGDATKETLMSADDSLGWYSSQSIMFNNNNSWLVRGGYWYDSTTVGSFAYYSTDGNAAHNISSRTVLVRR